MTVTALKLWHASQRKHEALNHKPDRLSGLCEKLDDLGVRLSNQRSQQIEARTVFEENGDDYEASAKKLSKNFDDLKTLYVQMMTLAIGDIEADEAAEQVRKELPLFAARAAKFANAARDIVKVSEHLANVLIKSGDRFIARRDAVDSVTRKVKTEGEKVIDQVTQQIALLRKVAVGMKNTRLANDLVVLNDEVGRLYPFN